MRVCVPRVRWMNSSWFSRDFFFPWTLKLYEYPFLLRIIFSRENLFVNRNQFTVPILIWERPKNTVIRNSLRNWTWIFLNIDKICMRSRWKIANIYILKVEFQCFSEKNKIRIVYSPGDVSPGNVSIKPNYLHIAYVLVSQRYFELLPLSVKFLMSSNF